MAKLTQRQRQSRQAKKIKARQQWRHALWCKMRVCMALAALALVGSLTYGMVTGKLQQQVAAFQNQTHLTIAAAGLAVDHIHLSGRQRTGMEEVKSAIGFELGESILRVDLDELRLRLETIPTVKHVAIARSFPNRLYIHLYERKPVAVWQYKGELALIDDMGAVMSDLSLHHYKNLPLLVGKGAPENVADILSMMQANGDLAGQIQSAIRVGDRRWDIRFKQGVTVKLPEAELMQAWNKLVTMQTEQQILLRHIDAIDMRNSERMYISVAPLPTRKPTLISTKDT